MSIFLPTISLISDHNYHLNLNLPQVCPQLILGELNDRRTKFLKFCFTTFFSRVKYCSPIFEVTLEGELRFGRRVIFFFTYITDSVS